MPFIAIFAALMIALGGSVAVGHAAPGDAAFPIKAAVDSHIGASAQGVLKALHIESDTDADVDADEHGNATSTAAHERNDERMEAHATSSANVHVGTGTRVKVDADNDGEDDGTEVHGDGSVNVRL